MEQIVASGIEEKGSDRAEVCRRMGKGTGTRPGKMKMERRRKATSEM